MEYTTIINEVLPWLDLLVITNSLGYVVGRAEIECGNKAEDLRTDFNEVRNESFLNKVICPFIKPGFYLGIRTKE